MFFQNIFVCYLLIKWQHSKFIEHSVCKLIQTIKICHRKAKHNLNIRIRGKNIKLGEKQKISNRYRQMI